MQLRPYQQAAVEAVWDHLAKCEDNPCVVIPTAGGKTPIMATLCQQAVGRWNGRVLVVAHVKELLQQTADKLHAVCAEVPYGVYSAGLGRRDTDHQVIVAGIQSVYQRACELGPFDLVLIDEAHLIPPDGEGMYRRFLADAQVVNPHLRVVGFTATPFRLKAGSICTPEGVLNRVCFEIGVSELIRDGYLCPLISKAGRAQADFGSLHVRGGEFVADETAALMDQDALVRAACAEIVAHTTDRWACLIFAAGVSHARHVADTLREVHGAECGLVTGDLPAQVRDVTLERFRRGELKFLANVNVLTTGFDAPRIDCVALLRPTLSPGLYYQMVGRGFRLHDDKRNCLVLDFGGNVQRHGPVDALRVGTPGGAGGGTAPVKQCPDCDALVAAGCARCPHCDYEFPPPQRARHAAEASAAAVLSDQVVDLEYEVRDVRYSAHVKRGAPPHAPQSLRVDYRLGLDHWHSEYVCFEHSGYPRHKAACWWRQRSGDPVPDTVQRALEIIQSGGLAATESVTVRSVAAEKFPKIVGYRLASIPEPAAVRPGPGDDEVPF